MKKHIHFKLFILLIFTGQLAFSQKEQEWFIGLHGAPTLSVSPMKHYHPMMGYFAGLSGQINFTKRFSLRVELNDERFGGYNDHIRPAWEGPSFTRSQQPYNGPQLTKEVWVHEQLLLPVSLKFNFISRAKTKAFIHLGNAIRYEFMSKQRYYFDDGTTRTESYKNSARMGNSYSTALIGGLGLDQQLYKNVHLIVEFRDHLFLQYLTTIGGNAFSLNTGISFKL